MKPLIRLAVLSPCSQNNQPRCKLLVASHFPAGVFSDFCRLPDRGFVEVVLGADVSARRKQTVGWTSAEQESLDQHTVAKNHPILGLRVAPESTRWVRLGIPSAPAVRLRGNESPS